MWSQLRCIAPVLGPGASEFDWDSKIQNYQSNKINNLTTVGRVQVFHVQYCLPFDGRPYSNIFEYALCSWNCEMTKNIQETFPSCSIQICCRTNLQRKTSWWLNQPILNKYARQIGSFPQVGVNIKHVWNHQLEKLDPSASPHWRFRLLMIFSHCLQPVQRFFDISLPIRSMGLEYLPTWRVDFYDKCRQILQPYGSYRLGI